MQTRSEQIEAAWKDYSEKKLTTNAFLNRITFQDNNICQPTYLFDADSVSNYYVLSQEDTEEIQPTPSTSMASNCEPSTSTVCTSKTDELLCCICHEKKSKVAVFPCKHFKTCLACWLHWKQLKKNQSVPEPNDDFEFIPNENEDVDINNENVQKHLEDEGEKLKFEVKCPYCNGIVQKYHVMFV